MVLVLIATVRERFDPVKSQFMSWRSCSKTHRFGDPEGGWPLCSLISRERFAENAPTQMLKSTSFPHILFSF